MAVDASSVKRSVASALPLSIGLPFLGMCAAFVVKCSGGRASAAAAFAMMASLLLVVFVALTRRRAPRAGIVAATCATSWAGLLALGVGDKLRDPIVYGMYGMRCGTGWIAFYVIVFPILAAMTFGLGLVCGGALARRSADRFTRGLAFVAVTTAGLVLAFEIPRWGRPDTDTYVDSLTIDQTLLPEKKARIGDFALEYTRATATLSMGEADPRFAECRLTGLAEPLSVRSTLLQSEACPPVRVRSDAAAGIVVLEAPVTCVKDSDDCWYPLTAVRTADGRELEVTPRLVSEHLAAPIGWRLGAAFGFVVAGVLLVVAERIRRRASPNGIEDALHHGEGRIEIAGRSFLSPEAASLPTGPVILFGVAEREASYRDVGAPRWSRAEAGTSAQRSEAILDIAASVNAVALAAAALGATPLVVARLFFGL